MYPKATWTTDNEVYNHSVTRGHIGHLQTDQTYKFRLLAFDAHGKQIMISSTKRLSLKFSAHLPVPQITDAWITNDGQISLKWKVNDSQTENIDGFIIYYRLVNLDKNFTKITIPNLRYPLIDTYTIS